MMAVRCPACSERVEGTSSEDLSRSIKAHFANIHKMEMEVQMNTSDEGCGPSTGSRSTEGPMERTGGPEEREPVRRPSRTTPGVETGPGAQAELGEGPSRASETEGIPCFECPVCEEEIGGSSEEEMSATFREHLTTTHKDEPFVTQLMEKVGSRR